MLRRNFNPGSFIAARAGKPTQVLALHADDDPCEVALDGNDAVVLDPQGLSDETGNEHGPLLVGSGFGGTKPNCLKGPCFSTSRGQRISTDSREEPKNEGAESRI